MGGLISCACVDLAMHRAVIHNVHIDSLGSLSLLAIPRCSSNVCRSDSILQVQIEAKTSMIQSLLLQSIHVCNLKKG